MVYDNNLEGFEAAQALRVGSAVTVRGKVVPSYKDPETPEIQASSITLEGDCPEDYPLQPKRHTVEFLREIAYLRPRTRLFQAVFRVRSVAAMAIHTYFQDRPGIRLCPYAPDHRQRRGRRRQHVHRDHPAAGKGRQL